MAAELSNQVYTAPQAPDYLGHYAELINHIPNYGLQFLAAQKAGTDNQTALAQYELMKQKAKAFLELYPAFKQQQLDKMAAQTELLREQRAQFPYRNALLQEQTALARARAGGLGPPPAGSKGAFEDVEVPEPPAGATRKAPAIDPNAPPPPPLAVAPKPSPTGGVPLLDIAAGNDEDSG